MDRNKLNALLATVLETVAETPKGIPEGPLYSMLMSIAQISYDDFTTLRAVCLNDGLVTSEDHVMYITTKGRGMVGQDRRVQTGDGGYDTMTSGMGRVSSGSRGTSGGGGAVRARRLAAEPEVKPDPAKVELGDVVSFGWHDVYNDGTVCQVHADGTVDVFRVYVHANDFSYAGSREGSSSVICYIGTEIVRNMKVDSLTVIRKAGPLR